MAYVETPCSAAESISSQIQKYSTRNGNLQKKKIFHYLIRVKPKKCNCPRFSAQNRRTTPICEILTSLWVWGDLDARMQTSGDPFFWWISYFSFGFKTSLVRFCSFHFPHILIIPMENKGGRELPIRCALESRPRGRYTCFWVLLVKFFGGRLTVM